MKTGKKRIFVENSKEKSELMEITAEIICYEDNFNLAGTGQ